MNKNYSLALIVGLLCLIVGVLFGRFMASNIGRYTFKDYHDGKMILDTKEGWLYFHNTESNRFFRSNIVQGEQFKEYKKN